jgi:adenylate kinase family enzyme
MRRYLIYGPSGSGKSTVGRELRRRGYRVIKADSEPGLSSWIKTATGERVANTPPFSKEWLAQHVWQWDAERMTQLLEDESAEVLFVVGGASNLIRFAHLFDKRFALYVNTETMVERLQAREPERWLEGSPELERMVERNNSFLEQVQGGDAVLIDGGRAVEDVAEDVLRRL